LARPVTPRVRTREERSVESLREDRYGVGVGGLGGIGGIGIGVGIGGEVGVGSG
jgi:hypothetical protein